MTLKKLADAQKRRHTSTYNVEIGVSRAELAKSIRKPAEMTAAEREEVRDRILADSYWGPGVRKSMEMWGISLQQKIEGFLSSPKAIAAASDWKIASPAYGPMRPHYDRWALHSNRNGWNVFAETLGRKRKPAVIAKVPTKPSTFYARLRNLEWIALELMKADSYYNVAVALGAGSSHLRVIDIDTLDQELAEALHEAANEILGVTPFVRVGKFPKRQLYYRCAPDDEQTIAIPTFSEEFLKADGTVDRDELDEKLNAVEFLSKNHNATLYGVHHSTKSYFDWSLGALHPAIAGPEHAPIITKSTLRAFFDRANAIRPFFIAGKNRGSDPRGNGGGAIHQFEQRGGVWLPSKFDGDWSVEDGRVVDGRERFLQHSVWAICAANVMRLASNADERCALPVAHGQSPCAPIVR